MDDLFGTQEIDWEFNAPHWFDFEKEEVENLDDWFDIQENNLAKFKKEFDLSSTLKTQQPPVSNKSDKNDNNKNVNIKSRKPTRIPVYNSRRANAKSVQIHHSNQHPPVHETKTTSRRSKMAAPSSTKQTTTRNIEKTKAPTLAKTPIRVPLKERQNVTKKL